MSNKSNKSVYSSRNFDPVCGKFAYPSMAKAKKALKNQLGHYSAKEAYHCESCGWFHLTSMRNSEYKEKIRTMMRGASTSCD